MKKLLLFIIIFVSTTLYLSAQAPDGFKYQAVARDANNLPQANANIALRISLIRDGVSGIIDYTERHSVTTTDLGVFSLQIGAGTNLSGDFSTLDWGNHSYFIKVDADPTGGTDYVYMGISQLLSVPYAIYAKNAGSGGNGGTPQTLTYDATTNLLSISNGNAITLPSGGTQGPQGEQGDQGVQGAMGIQGNQGAQGPVGVQGIQGPAGAGVQIIGSVANSGNLNPAYSGNIGDMFITQNDGHGHVWNGSSWDDVGQIQGPQGAQGGQGIPGIQGVQGAAGVDGATGSQGTQGSAGQNGATGPQGAMGLQGIAGTDGAMGAQGPAGAGVQIVGSVANAAALNPSYGGAVGDMFISQDNGHGHVWNGANWDDVGQIQGPAGADGATGATGAQGPVGATGNQGTAGAMGATGPQGATGSTGATGAQGIAGADGAIGAQGPAGAGVQIVGSVANAAALDPNYGGVIGDMFIAQDNGHGHVWNGTNWDDVGQIQGPVGSMGATGAQGTTGATGATGAQGIPGTTGATGTQGATGAQGTTGATGATGAQGIPGATGPQGATGPAGTYTEGAGIDITGNQISALDDSETNELQILNLVGNTLEISNANSVDLSGVGSSSVWSQSAFHAYYDLGFVGIGTSSPTANLEIESSSFTDMNITSTSNTGRSNLTLGNSTGGGPYFQFELGGSNLGGFFGDGTPLAGSASIVGSAATDRVIFGSLGSFTPVHFMTSATKRMTILGNGNVGIGTVTPQEKFVVEGTAGTIIGIETESSEPSGIHIHTNNLFSSDTYLELMVDRFSGGGSLLAGLDLNNLYIGTEGPAPLSFLTDATVRMHIASDGKVGIGNSTPDADLTIGDNMDSGWVFPYISAGNNMGGAINLGTPTSALKLAFTSGRGVMLCDDNTTRFPIEMITSNFSVSNNFGVSSDAMLFVQHGTDGLYLQHENNTNHYWELFASGVVGSPDLSLYTDTGEKGTFDAISGDYTSVSDRRLKTNIKSIGTILPSVMALSPSRYQFIHDKNKSAYLGFIAQDVQEIFPELVKQSTVEKEGDVEFTMNYSGFGIIAIKAIQEQQVVIEQQTTQIENQQKEIDELRLRLDRIETLLMKK